MINQWGKTAMKILIAEDDPVSCKVLETTLRKWGYEVVITTDGAEAWQALQAEAAPSLAILDWMMPQLDGVEVCRRVRQKSGPYTYIIMLTAKSSKEDISTALETGADDYVSKPFDQRELRARVKVGLRVLELEQSLARKISELQQALREVRQLKELLPICMYCKKIRDDQNYWHQIESYLHQHTKTDFSHGICPECYDRYMAERKRSKDEG
jgi:CheY-like chemotaxis protein